MMRGSVAAYSSVWVVMRRYAACRHVSVQASVVALPGVDRPCFSSPLTEHCCTGPLWTSAAIASRTFPAAPSSSPLRLCSGRQRTALNFSCWRSWRTLYGSESTSGLWPTRCSHLGYHELVLLMFKAIARSGTPAILALAPAALWFPSAAAGPGSACHYSPGDHCSRRDGRAGTFI